MPGLTPPDKRLLLRRNYLFRGLTDREADAILAYARLARYPAGAEIFAKGEPGDSMLAIAHGLVRISSTSAEGKQAVLNLIGEAEIFGEIALLDGKERTADATAITACELLVVERRFFLPVLRSDPDLCITLMTMLCGRLRRTSEQVEDMLFRDVEARLAKILLRLAREHGESAPGMLRIDVKLSQRELGDIAGATRESINKHLQAWQRSGIISLDKGSIVIRDADALEHVGY
ncbi:MAG: Crp/Fnr family transcriptional regulator [Alphaproteobacteria bacterium]|nr:Crp/Fnr family transcriptional regulator [Alphaproteobacteria bacterium]MBV9860901.1 Crp/Fnr family transcriptional regulator [Alphaproteobacteria bacterium]